MLSRFKFFFPLAVTGVLLWACMTRPLILNFDSAIPCNGLPFRLRPQDEGNVTELVPGDHVQLLYHFWLCRDMLAGKTPAFSNVYEFNTGDDASRRQFDTRYIPFSLVFSAVSSVAGNATGWNVTGLFAALVGLFGFFALARRFVKSPAVAFAIAVVSSSVPYRWVSILGGSPTGFAMTIVPWFLFGIDKAVRDKRVSGGFIAGISLLFCYCSDLHAFFFSTLFAPFWLCFSLLADDKPEQSRKKQLASAFRALLPTAAFFIVVLVLAKATASDLDRSSMSGGRELEELRVFSPVFEGLYRWHRLGYSNTFFIGAGLAVLIVFAHIFFAFSIIGKTEIGRRRLCFMVGLIDLAAVTVVVLALGTNGPFDGLPVRLARKCIPKYDMIRQPLKIFCVLPPTLCVMLSLLCRKIAGAHFAVKSVAAVLAAITVGEHMMWVSPSLCRLPDGFDAYHVASAYARQNGISNPLAICIPFFEGGAHYSSIYEYGAMDSRIRLVNGYAPNAPEGFQKNIYEKLASINSGELTGEQLKILVAMGVDFIIYHDPFLFSKIRHFTTPQTLPVLRANQLLKEIYSKDGIVVFLLAVPNANE